MLIAYNTRKMVSSNKILEIVQNRYTSVVFNTEHENDTLRCHIPSMSHEYESSEKKVSNYKKKKFAQNRLPGILFDAEDEYDTLRCHIPGMNHDTVKKRVSEYKFFEIAQNWLTRVYFAENPGQ